MTHERAQAAKLRHADLLSGADPKAAVPAARQVGATAAPHQVEWQVAPQQAEQGEAR